MLIALDYDFTFTEDPALWETLIREARLRGHQVICVTGRHEPPFPNEVQLPEGTAIVCAGDLEKRKAAEKAGYKVNVWIDDMPETVGPCIKLQWD